jgi:hypothetical protein
MRPERGALPVLVNVMRATMSWWNEMNGNERLGRSTASRAHPRR